MLEYIIFAVTVIIVLILAIFSLWPGSKRNTTIPGPDICDELEGNLPDITASGSLHEFLLDLHNIYGSITSFWLGPQFCVSIASPQLLKEQSNVFDRPKPLFELFEPLLTPNSIQFANGGEGRKRHSEYSKSYTPDAIRDYFSMLVKCSKDLSKKLNTLANEEHIPLGQYMFAFAIKTMMSASFGKHFDDEKEVLEFKKAYDFAWGEMESRLGGEHTDSAREEKFEKCKEKMYSMLMKAADVAKNNPREDGDQPKFVDNILEMGLSKDVIKADMLTMCIGGIHTTGYLLTWAIYFMASHPDVQDKVYDELQDIIGEETIAFDAVNRLKYMRQVLDETLRCSILAPYAARVQDIDTELGGHKIPAGTPVVHALGVVLQDEKIWPEPEEFDPERFSEENRKKIPAYAFEPFGFAGKRKCPGYRFSYFEATVLLSELIRKFKINMVEGQVVQKVYGLVTKPMDEIWISVEKRK